jgi:hypothetical protein
VRITHERDGALPAVRRDVPLRTGWAGAGLALSRELEFEAKRSELRLQKVGAGQAHEPRVQPAVSSEDPEIPRLMGTWIQADEDIARSLAERKPSAPTPLREEVASRPKKPVDRARHAAYMRGWRQQRALRKLLGEA